MTSEPQRTGELSRLLRRLGEEPLQQRDHEQEGRRAEAVAQHLNRELASLVRQRRAALLRPLLVAAAALILGIGAWQLGWPRPGRLAIEQEPLAPGAAVRTEPGVSDPPEPAPRQQPAPRALTDGRPRRAPSSSAQPGAATAAVPSGSEQAHSSTLADENRLFKDAAEATRAGDTDGALRQFDRLLEQYPASPLAQTALVRKLRLLDKAGRSDAAVAAASRYLELYPNGFAASEAQALVRGQVNPPTSPEPQP
ncbi:MAG TPA: tetratricopeptide repeat protein [Polyangiaceae bacterium]|nr:tetratricopeptide repeat protein [Polyangiaceae bacterium]